MCGYRLEAREEESIKSDIKIKSLGFLVDQLCTTSRKCFDAQNKIMDESLSEHDRLQAAIEAQKQNATRSKLIKAIDESVGQGEISMGGTKTYDKSSNYKP